MARMVTGSVAEMRAPKWRLSMKVMFCRWGTTLKYSQHYHRSQFTLSNLPCDSIHEAPNCEGADNCSDEGEGEDGANVAEKVLLLHGIARVEDDWGEKDVEENLWVERSFLVNLIVWPVGNLGSEIKKVMAKSSLSFIPLP